MVRDELRHEVIPVAEPAASVVLQRKAQRQTKFIGIGGGEITWFIGHAGRLDQS
jgi:3-dehydroquinate synthetase